MSVLNPYYVFINSRDRENGTDENFTYNIAFPTGYEYDRVVVLNCLIPKSYYLIQGGIEGSFKLKENATTITINVPIGSYLLSAFRTTIGTLLSNASPNGLVYSVTYPPLTGPDTGKWTFTQTNAAIVSVLIFNDQLFEPFGFYAGSTNAFSGTTLTSTCVIKLQSEDRLLIHSNICANPGMDDVLVSINSTTSINYSSISYVCPAPEFYSRILSSQNNNTYNFSLSDENNGSIPLNGLNMNITLLFYKKDNINELIRNFLKMIVLKDQKEQ